MKTIILLVLITTLTSVSYGQKFMGVKNTTKKGWAVFEFKQRGFELMGETTQLDEPCVLMMNINKKDTIFAGIVYRESDKHIKNIQILCPPRENWTDLDIEYEKRFKILVDLYGEPKVIRKYITTWDFPKTHGQVTLSVAKEKYVRILCIWD